MTPTDEALPLIQFATIASTIYTQNMFVCRKTRTFEVMCSKFDPTLYLFSAMETSNTAMNKHLNYAKTECCISS